MRAWRRKKPKPKRRRKRTPKKPRPRLPPKPLLLRRTSRRHRNPRQKQLDGSSRPDFRPPEVLDCWLEHLARGCKTLAVDHDFDWSLDRLFRVALWNHHRSRTQRTWPHPESTRTEPRWSR